MRNLTSTIGTIMEITGVVVLTAYAIKAENERHKAVVELRNVKTELFGEKLKNVVLYVENCKLENQLKKETEAEA